MKFIGHKYSYLLKAINELAIGQEIDPDTPSSNLDFWISNNLDVVRSHVITDFTAASKDKTFSWFEAASLAEFPVGSSSIVFLWSYFKKELWDRITTNEAPIPWFDHYVNYKMLLQAISYVTSDLRGHSKTLDCVLANGEQNNPEEYTNFRQLVISEFESATFDKSFSWKMAVRLSKYPIEGSEDTLWLLFKQHIWDKLTTKQLLRN